MVSVITQASTHFVGVEDVIVDDVVCEVLTVGEEVIVNKFDVGDETFTIFQ